MLSGIPWISALTSDQQFYAVLVLSVRRKRADKFFVLFMNFILNFVFICQVFLAWAIAKFTLFFQNIPKNNSRYTWLIYDCYTADEIKEMVMMRFF